ncbi:hypothetical protein [Streptomyces sp. NPDC050392]|uniref:hypothetical protein n=1 Tax=Streptomyces sp. NPDC050392 TaxID=3155782 RepID=UPI0034168D1B
MNSQLQFTAWFKDPSPDAEADDEVSELVVGWRAADGAAMVLEPASGRVVPAAEQAGFKYIERQPDTPPLGVVPGNGWRITKTGQGPAGGSARPVAAFLVYADHVVPVVNLPSSGDYRGAWKSRDWRLLEPND